MPNTKDLAPGKYGQYLFLGRSGTRKSTVAASFPSKRYMFDFDRRFNALRSVDVEFDYYPQHKGWGLAEKKFESILQAEQKGQPLYETIMICSMTSMLRFYLAEALSYYETLRNPQGQPSGFRVPRIGTDPLLLTDMPHYKFVHQALESCINEHILPMRANVIIEAHTQSIFDSDGNRIGTKLLASDSLAELIPTRFDETWQFIYKKPTNSYWIRFRGEIAKTSYRELPDEVEITDKEHVFYDEIFLPLIGGESA